MSVSITTGLGSLINLGMGAGDLAVLYSTGRQLGNWLTASSGDKDFLNLLQEDENEILRRRGVFDLHLFNTRWRQQLSILFNGEPRVINGEEVMEVLPPLSRFTAIMVVITATLDEFMTFLTMKRVLLLLFKLLSGGIADGQDVIDSQIQHRLNSWRSVARVRGLPVFLRVLRSGMIKDKRILPGLMPNGDALEVAEFLQWLLADSSEEFSTNSSDVAGVATCLSLCGFNTLGISSFGQESVNMPCRLVYTEKAFLHQKASNSVLMHAVSQRAAHTTVSLAHPEETFFSFPVSSELAMICRSAWLSGATAAAGIKCTILTGPEEANIDSPTSLDIELVADRHYLILDIDSSRPIHRARQGVFELVSRSFPVSTQRLLRELEDTMKKENDDT
jgi:hypothetical protein